MSASAGKRVLMLIENSSFPEDLRMHRQARSLSKAGYRVTVISTMGPRRGGWHEVVDGVSVYRFPNPPEADGFAGYVLEYSYAMLAIFILSLIAAAREGFDIIHAANPPDTLVFIAAIYKLAGKRFVFDHHDLAPEMYMARFPGRGSSRVFRALVWLEKLSYSLADHVIVTNESYKTVAMQRGEVPERQITIVRNGPDLADWKLQERDPELRAKAPNILAFAGMMGAQDGVDHLLRALHYLRSEMGREDFYCLLIGGRGGAQPYLKELAKRLSLEDHVWFSGWVSPHDYLRLISTADICVDPDPSNPFNDRSTMNKIMEYMALEKPVVAFDLPEHRFSAADAAVYAAPNSIEDMARCIAVLMDDPSLRHQLGQAGRRRVEQALAWQHSVPNLLSAYDKLTAQEPVRFARAGQVRSGGGE